VDLVGAWGAVAGTAALAWRIWEYRQGAKVKLYISQVTGMPPADSLRRDVPVDFGVTIVNHADYPVRIENLYFMPSISLIQLVDRPLIPPSLEKVYSTGLWRVPADRARLTVPGIVDARDSCSAPMNVHLPRDTRRVRAYAISSTGRRVRSRRIRVS
jgi:hypothetical protein